MRVDLRLFQDLYANLSRVVQRDFEVWDLEGLVFRSRPAGGGFPPEGSRKLAAAVAEQWSFQTVPCGSGTRLSGYPILYADGVVGTLVALEETGRTAEGPDGDAERFLRPLAEIVEDKLTSFNELEKMTEELTRSFEGFCLYTSMATEMKSWRFSSTFLANLVSRLLETMRSELAFAVFPERPEYHSLFCNEPCQDRIPDPERFVGDLLGTIPTDAPTLKESYFIVNSSVEMPAFAELHTDPFRFLAVAIEHGGTFYGWLGLVSFNMNEIFRRGELRLLASMAEQVAIVITNSDLYHDLEGFVINVVKSLVSAIEAKDTYTRGHSERVNHYSLLIADALGMDEKKKEELNWASILHDVGKIGIPETILNKPGPLNDQEYTIIKQHPRKGYTILEPLKQLSGSLIGILHHHERPDGRGYPDGLQGNQIPLMARIIAVADTFDAIASSRAYRSARPKEEAMAILEEVAGKQLDAGLVQIFRGIFDKQST